MLLELEVFFPWMFTTEKYSLLFLFFSPALVLNSVLKSCGYNHFVSARQVASSGNSLIYNLLVKRDLAEG